MSTHIFKPKVPKNREANIFQDVGGKFRVDVRLKRKSGELFRKQARGIEKEKAARDKRDEFYEEFNILEGGPQYANRLIPLEDETPEGHNVDSWLDECISTHWPRRVPATVRDYTQASRDHVKPFLGDVPLSDLTGRQITDWIYQLRNKEVELQGKEKKKIKLSISSLKAAKTALSSALTLAVEHGLLESNPALGLRIRWSAISQDRRTERQENGDPEDQPEKRLLTIHEVNRLLRTAKGKPIYSLILLQCKLGLRIGEALGLRRKDFDLRGNIVRVRHQLKWSRAGDKEILMLTDLKTKASRRDIPLPKSVASLVKAVTDPEAFLVRSEGNGRMEPRKAQKLLTSAFEDAKLSGVPGKADPTSHNLRFHWTSRLLNDLAVPVTVVSRLAGHSQITTTLAYYSEATAQNMADAMSKVD